MTFIELQRDHFVISTDPARLDVDAIWAFLARSYWAQNRPRDIIERSIKHSLCFGLFDHDKQIGFARMITDFSTFAYLCDVFVDESYRGRGLGKWLMSAIMSHPDLQDLWRWCLSTMDAHGLYRQYGFTELKMPERWMEIFKP